MKKQEKTLKKAPGFILEKDQKEIIDELTNEEAGIIFKAIYEYETTNEEPNLEKSLRIVFKQFKVKLDFYDGKYKTKCETNKKNIQEYWDKVKNTNEYECIQSNTMATNKSKVKKRKEKKSKENVCVIEEHTLDETDTPDTHTLIFNFCSPFFASYNQSDLEKSCKKFFNYYQEKSWQGVNDWQEKAKMWMEDDIENGKIRKGKNKVEVINGITYENGKRLL